DINWEMNIWRIPVTKNGEPVTVPLVGRAMDILQKRKLCTNSDWVFPSLEDVTKHFVNFKRAWIRTRQKATIYLWAEDSQYTNLIDEHHLTVNGYEGVSQAFNQIVERSQ